MDRGNTGVPLSLVLINSHSAQRQESHVGNGIMICRVKSKGGNDVQKNTPSTQQRFLQVHLQAEPLSFLDNYYQKQ